MNDGMRMTFYAEKVEYPYLWGQRFVGERMPLREMRIDLREVRNLRIVESG